LPLVRELTKNSVMPTIKPPLRKPPRSIPPLLALHLQSIWSDKAMNSPAPFMLPYPTQALGLKRVHPAIAMLPDGGTSKATLNPKPRLLRFGKQLDVSDRRVAPTLLGP
jgi:hypothetical protein